jgi:hypothetical protein
MCLTSGRMVLLASRTHSAYAWICETTCREVEITLCWSALLRGDIYEVENMIPNVFYLFYNTNATYTTFLARISRAMLNYSFVGCCIKMKPVNSISESWATTSDFKLDELTHRTLSPLDPAKDPNDSWHFRKIFQNLVKHPSDNKNLEFCSFRFVPHLARQGGFFFLVGS